MVVTLDQQYNIGEKPTVILYTYKNRHAGTQKKQRRQNSTSSNIVVITYCNENTEGHDVDIFIIQNVQDTVIHMEVD